ncbi:MAG: hypothetical protein ACXITR_00715 [Cyanobacterium sp.]
MFTFISLFAIKIKFRLKNQLNLRLSFAIIPIGIKPVEAQAKTRPNIFVKEYNSNRKILFYRSLFPYPE